MKKVPYESTTKVKSKKKMSMPMNKYENTQMDKMIDKKMMKKSGRGR